MTITWSEGRRKSQDSWKSAREDHGEDTWGWQHEGHGYKERWGQNRGTQSFITHTHTLSTSSSHEEHINLFVHRCVVLRCVDAESVCCNECDFDIVFSWDHYLAVMTYCFMECTESLHTDNSCPWSHWFDERSYVVLLAYCHLWSNVCFSWKLHFWVIESLAQIFGFILSSSLLGVSLIFTHEVASAELVRNRLSLFWEPKFAQSKFVIT